jgi:3-oxoacyl-[acyl-carrier protein] reductase
MVTGAGAGIGRGIVSALLDQGAEVVAVDKDAAALTAAFADVPAVKSLASDLGTADAQELASEIEHAAGGPIELIVQNAGVATDRSYMATEPAEFDSVFTVNVRTPWFLTRALLRPLVEAERPGGVIFVSSLHADVVRLQPDYSSSKAAIRMLVKELAYELSPYRIRVNAVTPGAIESASVVVDEAVAEYASQLIPLGRIGQPQDVARVIVALLSDELGGYVTGTNVVVDGGLGLHSWAMDPRP